MIQYQAGAPELLNRYRNAVPAVRALIDAAMDAARLGMRGALPQAFLETAAAGYLTDTEWGMLPGDGLKQALVETDTPAKGIRGPLTALRPRPGVQVNTSGDGSARQLADYLDQHGCRVRREEIPSASFWGAAVSFANAADLTALAYAAAERGLLRDTARLYKQASGYGDPSAGADFVRLLHTLHPGDQHPAEWATVHVGLDNPYGVTSLLEALDEAGATSQVTTLLDRDPAAHADLDDPHGVALLLGALDKMGATGQVTALLDRDPAAHASLDKPGTVQELLFALDKVGATGQVTALAGHATAHVSLDDPGGVASLLDALNRVGATSQVAALLGRDPAAHANLDDPGGVASLLDALNRVGATSQVAALLGRGPAAHASLDDPGGVAVLLVVLDRVGERAMPGSLAVHRRTEPACLPEPRFLASARPNHIQMTCAAAPKQHRTQAPIRCLILQQHFVVLDLFSLVVADFGAVLVTPAPTGPGPGGGAGGEGGDQVCQETADLAEREADEAAARAFGAVAAVTHR